MWLERRWWFKIIEEVGIQVVAHIYEGRLGKALAFKCAFFYSGSFLHNPKENYLFSPHGFLMLGREEGEGVVQQIFSDPDRDLTWPYRRPTCSSPNETETAPSEPNPTH